MFDLHKLQFVMIHSEIKAYTKVNKEKFTQMSIFIIIKSNFQVFLSQEFKLTQV